MKRPQQSAAEGLKAKLFELTIMDAGVRGNYVVYAATQSQGHENCRVSPQLPRPDFGDFLKEDTLVTLDDIRKQGEALFDSFFVEGIRTLFNMAVGEAFGRDDLFLRLVLRIDPPELAILPWEALFFKERNLFLSTSPRVSLSRTYSAIVPYRSISCPEVLRILFIAPQDNRLDRRSENLALNQLKKGKYGRVAIHKLVEKATKEAIRKVLREREIHLVHYSGHGSFDGSEATIYLDDEFSDVPYKMPASAFAELFLDVPSIRLIVLNSCEGASRSPIRALAGATPHLLLRGVPAVLAMQSVVFDHDANRFADVFYAELAAGSRPGDIEAALARARSALLQDRPTSPAFASPVLYLRAESGQLWRNAPL